MKNTTLEISGSGMSPFAGMFKASFTPNPEQTIKDRRTEEQQQTHTRAIVAYDAGMSGWGGARDGKSYCAWACAPDVNVEQVREWVNNRSDMSEVEEIDLSDYQLPTDVSNLSIYVVNNGHPSTLPVS